VRAAAETFRSNPNLDVASVITELGVGEALVSLLDESGKPTVVQRTLMCPPHSLVGPISAQQRQAIIQQSTIYGHYEKLVDRESAYEIIKGRAESAAAQKEEAAPARGRRSVAETLETESAAPKPQGGRQREGVVEAMAKSAARAVGSQLGRQILRGVLGSLLGGGKR